MRHRLWSAPAPGTLALLVGVLVACHPRPGPPDDAHSDPSDTDTVADTDVSLDTDGPTGARCGDGVRTPDELCDDGNADETDDCTRACTPTPPPGADALAEVVGAVSCDPRAEPNVVDPSWLGVTAHVTGVALLEDGASDAPLSRAMLTFAAPGRASTSMTTDDSTGEFAADLDVCTAWTARLTDSGGWASTRHALAFFDDADTLRLRVASLNELETIAQLAGGALSDTRGVVAGHAVDCDGVGVADVMIVLRAEDGATRLDLPVVYLDSDSGGRTTTPSDGAYVIPNVPPGTVWVETWARRGGEVALRARAPVQVVAESVEWVEVPWGRLDGTRLDPRCASPP